MSDLNFKGEWTPAKKGDGSIVIADIDNIIIDEHMIKFHILPYYIDGETYSYDVNLNADFVGKGFIGEFNDTTDRDYKGHVECELFENRVRYFLYGKWTEEETNYTWWAILDKNASR